MIMAGFPPVIPCFGNSIAAIGTNGKSGNRDAAGHGEPAKHSEKFHNIRVLPPKPAVFLPEWQRIPAGTGRSGQPAENSPDLQRLYTAPAETGDCFFAKKV
ncbi:hypothetical protein JNO48_07085 [Clostridiales bacterium]|nr:hypothetical protein JNO48_07085 [Clostridiales bacterium]